jgi:hypothetical protein
LWLLLVAAIAGALRKTSEDIKAND